MRQGIYLWSSTIKHVATRDGMNEMFISSFQAIVTKNRLQDQIKRVVRSAMPAISKFINNLRLGFPEGVVEQP